MTEARSAIAQKQKKKWPLIVMGGLVIAALWGFKKYQEARLYGDAAG